MSTYRKIKRTVRKNQKQRIKQLSRYTAQNREHRAEAKETDEAIKAALEDAKARQKNGGK